MSEAREKPNQTGAAFLCLSLAIFLLLPQFLTFSLGQDAAQEARKETVRQEESDDYFKKWLNEDVTYIITDEEKAVFQKLATPDEKEQFIEQFWRRRDLDLSTTVNEYKEEHYRRIAYANEKFASALPGWKTDRGRVYIIHGPPSQIEAHPSGGTYTRPMHEGGGTTGTYPFEIWYYRYLEGIGSDVELQFVDPSFSEEYRLAMRPEEKDAFLNVQGGFTLAEEMGIASKKDRPSFNPGSAAARRGYPFMFERLKDQPFQRYQTYTYVQRAPELKRPELKEAVNVNVSYATLPFKVRSDYFRLNEAQVLVPISIELLNRDLSFVEENGVFVAKLGVYGVVTSIGNEVIHEFEDDITSTYPPEQLEQGLRLRSMYQKTIPLGARTRYKVDLVVKDLRSGKVGVTRHALIPPSYPEGELSVSTVILTDQIRVVDVTPEKEMMFVLGDLWILPILNRAFSNDRPLGVYVQVYGVEFDQTTLQPSVTTTYRVVGTSGETVAEVVDDKGDSIQFFSAQRLVLLHPVPIDGLPPGDYRMVIEVEDHIKNRRVTTQDSFKVLPPAQVAAR